MRGRECVVGSVFFFWLVNEVRDFDATDLKRRGFLVFLVKTKWSISWRGCRCKKSFHISHLPLLIQNSQPVLSLSLCLVFTSSMED